MLSRVPDFTPAGGSTFPAALRRTLSVFCTLSLVSKSDSPAVGDFRPKVLIRQLSCYSGFMAPTLTTILANRLRQVLDNPSSTTPQVLQASKLLLRCVLSRRRIGRKQPEKSIDHSRLLSKLQ